MNVATLHLPAALAYGICERVLKRGCERICEKGALDRIRSEEFCGLDEEDPRCSHGQGRSQCDRRCAEHAGGAALLRPASAHGFEDSHRMRGCGKGSWLSGPSLPQGVWSADRCVGAMGPL